MVLIQETSSAVIPVGGDVGSIVGDLLVVHIKRLILCCSIKRIRRFPKFVRQENLRIGVW